MRTSTAVASAKAGVRVQEPLQICLGAGLKAKTVTNNLPILSVLAEVFISRRKLLGTYNRL